MTYITEQEIPILLEGLRLGLAKVNFIKKNGELRRMICTLCPSLIPTEHTPKGTREENEDESILRVFDTENQGWRSIICANILSFGPNA